MHQSRAQTVAAGLGLFSIGLGLAELIAPRLVRQAMGFRCSDSVVRLYGAGRAVILYVVASIAGFLASTFAVFLPLEIAFLRPAHLTLGASAAILTSATMGLVGSGPRASHSSGDRTSCSYCPRRRRQR